MRLVVPARLEPVVSQIRGNPRLQAGLALIALLFLGWVFLLLGDVRDSGIVHLEQSRERLFQMRRLAGQDIWLQRAIEASRLADALEAEIPSVQSAGLAQASLQGSLQELVDNMGVDLRLEMQAPVPVEDSDLVKVTAILSGGIEPGRAWELIHRIESNTALVTIPMLLVRTDGANKTMSLTVQAFYRLPPAVAAETGP